MKPTKEQLKEIIQDWVSTLNWDDNPSDEEVDELAQSILEATNE